MSFDRLRETARTALRKSEGLGFDSLCVTAVQSRLLGVRIANGSICRENIDRLAQNYEVRGAHASREGGFDGSALSESDLHDRISTLRRTLPQQPADAEYIAANVAGGSYSYDLAVTTFDDAYSPESLYRTVARLSRQARERGLRLTGYIEAQETSAHRWLRRDQTETDIATHDHGLTVSLTLDDPKTGAISTGNRGVARATSQRVQAALEAAYHEAERQCLAAQNPTPSSPGDYTVILHPQAVVDIVNTALMYGMFDRRKIDEGRTFLSGRSSTLRFPTSLSLSQTPNLALTSNDTYLDMPFNHRLVACTDLSLIADGRIQGLHTGAYWAKQCHVPETYDANASAPATAVAVSSAADIELVDDLASLIQRTERGFYVANTWYLRMVTEMDGVITGMTRDGVFAIEDGKLVGPVLNMRWHDNPFRILGSISGATRERMLFGRSRLAGQGRTRLSVAPALRIEGFHMSSVTKF